MSLSSVVIVFAAVLLHLWLASCSKQACNLECLETVELTEQFISHVNRHFKSGPTDPLFARLRESLNADGSLKRFCVKYLVGSVAIRGSVSNHGLRTVRELCDSQIEQYLPNLLKGLIDKNDFETVVHFFADCLMSEDHQSSMKLIEELMRRNRGVLAGLTTKVLAILKGQGSKGIYNFMLKQLPAEQQYEMIRAGEVPLEEINQIYSSGKYLLSLREIFFLARCSHDPSPEIRKAIADMGPAFKECLADDDTASNVKSRCPENTPTLVSDALYYISNFMDFETMAFVMPLVSRSWRSVHLKLLKYSTTMHAQYMLDLESIILGDIYTIGPWNYYLRNEAQAIEYAWRCTRYSIPDSEPPQYLQYIIKMYIEAIIKGKCALPEIENCDTAYDVFLKLLEMLHGLYIVHRPILDKPTFLTVEDYGRAIHFLCSKGRILDLPESLTTKSMPELFAMINEDEEVMERLVRRAFKNFEEPAIVLMEQSQTKAISEKLIKMVFNQTVLFRRFVEPVMLEPRECYSFVVESKIVHEMVMTNYGKTGSQQFVISLLLSFKKDQDKINKIVAMMNARPPNFDTQAWNRRKSRLGGRCFSLLDSSPNYTRNDVEFAKEVLMRCGLWDDPEE